MAWIREFSSRGQCYGVRLVAARGHFGVVDGVAGSWSSEPALRQASAALTDGNGSMTDIFHAFVSEHMLRDICQPFTRRFQAVLLAVAYGKHATPRSSRRAVPERQKRSKGVHSSIGVGSQSVLQRGWRLPRSRPDR